MVRLLKRFARCESPTDSKPAVDHFGRMVAEEWRRRGAKIEYLPRKREGNHLRITWPADRARWVGISARAGQILVLGHLDTVYSLGTIKKMPFRVRRGRAFGPGVFDMKGGIDIALFAVDALAHAGWLPRRRIVFLWTSDEETGSKRSREVIEQGGTRSNVIPAEARLTIDLRAETVADMRRIERKLKTLRPILPGARVTVEGGFSRPPLERRASAALFSQASKLAEQLGFSVGECLAGGGSDGNFTAALGVPTLDGLGAVGEGPHSPDEQVIIAALPQRAALLAALLVAL